MSTICLLYVDYFTSSYGLQKSIYSTQATVKWVFEMLTEHSPIMEEFFLSGEPNDSNIEKGLFVNHELSTWLICSVAANLRKILFDNAEDSEKRRRHIADGTGTDTLTEQRGVEYVLEYGSFNTREQKEKNMYGDAEMLVSS